MNNQLYTELKTQLETVTDIQFINRWNNQLEHLRQKEVDEYPYNFPAVFIEFYSPNEIQSIGNNVQIYDPLDIIIHIIFDQLDTGDGNMENNFDVITLKQKIYMALTLFRPTNTSNLVRRLEEQDYEHDNIYEYKQTYRCTFTDYDGQLPIGGGPRPEYPATSLEDNVNFT